MKKTLRHFRHLSLRTISYLSLSILFAIILFYSCRKVDRVLYGPTAPPINPAAIISKNDLLAWYNDLPIQDLNNLNASIGLTSGNGKLPFPLQWDKAQQRIIKGKHVVKVPLGINALIVFEKQGNNGPLTSCIYKWEDSANKGKSYTGRVLRFSFQNYYFIGQEFRNNKKIGTVKIHVTDDITPDDLTKLREALRTPAAANQLKTNSLKTQSIFGDIFNTIMTNVIKAVEAVGCTLINEQTHWGYGAFNYLPNGASTTVGSKGAEKLKCGPEHLVNLNFSTDPNDPAPGDDTAQIPAGDDFISIGMSTDGSCSCGESSGGSSSGGDSSGGGSSGSGGWAYNPFSNLSSIFWTSYLQFASIAPPKIIDNIDPQYVCAKALLASLPSLRSDITNVINKTFGVNTNIPLTFTDVSQASLGNSTTDAHTTGFDVHISRDVLSYATKEYILAVIFHEALHAFLEYELNTLGAPNFANLYPAIKVHEGTIGDKKFWFDNGPGVPVSYVSSDPQHRHMAEYFMDKMAEGIKAFNPNIPEPTLQAMIRYGIFDDANSYLNNNERDTRIVRSDGTKYVGTKCP